MAHLALYREFRPKTFDEVIGQNHIVTTLKNQIQSGTISHAYLFCGTRGTGKTSCAKIFARAVNCQNQKNGSACGECEVCQKIDANGNLDIVEIDAASNNRVDEIRDLREKVNYLPTVGKYKVYIIDEVHMLTDSAFNALLKTLEEPPKHIIFILATTEPEKLPATILSRCMRFDFKLVSVEELVKLLKRVLTASNATFEDDALTMIATAGNGSVRDTLSIAEMCKAFSNNNITANAVEECLGLTDFKTIKFLSYCIVQKDGGSILQKIDELYKLGKNMNTLISDLCNFFKNALTHKLASGYDLKAPQNMIEGYDEIASQCNNKQLLDILKGLTTALAQIKFSTNDKVFVQTSLLSLFYNDNLEIELLKQRIDKLEKSNFINIVENNSQNIQFQNYQQNQTKTENLQKKTENININSNPFEKTDTISQQQTSIVSNLTNGGQTANAVLGELISFARQNGEMLLYAGFSDIQNVSIQNNQFIFCSKTGQLKMLIDEHKDFITNFLKQKYNLNGYITTIYVDKQKERLKELSQMLDGKLTLK